jgi:hypothetical protein
MRAHRLPPFAERLAERLATGWRPAGRTLHIAAGSGAWERGREWAAEPGWRGWVIIPDTARYDLHVVRGWDVILHRTGITDQDLDVLAVDLVIAGAVRVVTTIAGRIVSYRPLTAVAA